MLSLLYDSLENEDNKDCKDCKDCKDNNHITIINGVSFHTIVLNTTSYFKNISNTLPSEFDDFVDELLILRKILYEKEVYPSNNETDKKVYILFDFLCLGIPKYLYQSSSKELYTYLLQQCYTLTTERFLKHLHINCSQIDVILDDITWEFRFYYISKLTDDKKIVIRDKIKNSNKPADINNYAYLLLYGIGGNRDMILARQLYLKNWEENKFEESCVFYSVMLYYGIGGEKNEEKAKELFLLNWEEHNNYNSLYHYANVIKKEDSEKSRELFLYIWNNFKLDIALASYAIMLANGDGGEQNIDKALELHKQNWEENKNELSLLNYAKLCYLQDNDKARNLVRYGWEKLKNQDCLNFYIRILRMGTEEDIKLANELDDCLI